MTSSEFEPGGLLTWWQYHLRHQVKEALAISQTHPMASMALKKQRKEKERGEHLHYPETGKASGFRLSQEAQLGSESPREWL